jgi:hypothetical protein
LKINKRYNKKYGTKRDANAGAVIIHKTGTADDDSKKIARAS